MKLYGKFAQLFHKNLNEPFSVYAPNTEKWDSKHSYRFVEDGIESMVGKNKWESWGSDTKLLLKGLLDGKLVVVPNWNKSYKSNMVRIKQIADGKYLSQTPMFLKSHLAYVKKLLRKLPVQPGIDASKKNEYLRPHIVFVFFQDDKILEFRIYDDNTIYVWKVGGEESDAGKVSETDMLEYIKDFYRT